MAGKIHVNPDTGKVGQCKVNTGFCPFAGENGDENHFNTEQEARDFYESLQKTQLRSIKKKERKSARISKIDNGIKNVTNKLIYLRDEIGVAEDTPISFWGTDGRIFELHNEIKGVKQVWEDDYQNIAISLKERHGDKNPEKEITLKEMISKLTEINNKSTDGVPLSFWTKDGRVYKLSEEISGSKQVWAEEYEWVSFTLTEDKNM